jgi:hypothetical protein
MRGFVLCVGSQFVFNPGRAYSFSKHLSHFSTSFYFANIIFADTLKMRFVYYNSHSGQIKYS